jgi:hypothetical protein
MSSVTDMSKMFFYCSALKDLRFNTEINASANLSSTFSDAGGASSYLYYYPHASFVEKFLPKVPAKWQKIDITTLTE